MPDKSLPEMKVAILVTDGVEQAELEQPRKALSTAGAQTVLLSPKKGAVQAMNHAEKGDEFPVDMQLEDARPEEFDAVLLPGGVINADKLRMDEHARRFVQIMENAGKPIAVICHGPWLLVSAGLAKGRRLTSYYTLQDDLRNAGAEWFDQETVRDKNWISSRQPNDIPAFNRGMVELFAAHRRSAQSTARA